MLVPKLRFPGFEDEWRVLAIGDIFDFKRNNSLSRSQLSDTGDVNNIHYGDIHTVLPPRLDIGRVALSKVSKEILTLKDEDTLSVGDLLLADASEDYVDIGKAVEIVGNTDHPTVAGLHTIVLSPKIEFAAGFLGCAFQSDFIRRQLMRLAVGVSVLGISKTSVRTVELSAPGIKEQQKIANFLMAVDERIELQSHKVEKLQTYKRGLTQKIFTRTLRFKCDDGSDFPEWGEMKLGDLADEKAIKMGRGKVISAVDINNKPGNYPIYSSSVKNNGLFGRCGDYMFDKELISWSVDGGGHFFYRPPHKFSITNVSGFIEVVDSGSVNVRFLAHQLQYLHGRQSFDYTTKAHPSVIRNLYVVGLPAIEEQQKIATLLSQIDEKITLETKKLEGLKKFKKALLQRMFV